MIIRVNALAVWPLHIYRNVERKRKPKYNTKAECSRLMGIIVINFIRHIILRAIEWCLHLKPECSDSQCELLKMMIKNSGIVKGKQRKFSWAHWGSILLWLFIWLRVDSSSFTLAAYAMAWLGFVWICPHFFRVDVAVKSKCSSAI